MRAIISILVSSLLLFSCDHRESAINDLQLAVQLPDEGNNILKSGSIAIYKDASSQLSFEQVQNQKFEIAHTLVPNFGYSSSTIWVKINIDNVLNTGAWFLVIENPNLDEVELYWQGQDTNLPFMRVTKESKKFINYFFSIKQGQQTAYLKVRSKDSLALAIRIAEANYLLENRHRLDMWQGLYYGIILSVIVFNIFVFISLKDVAYLYYILFAFFMMLVSGHVYGYLGNVVSSNYKFIDCYYLPACLSGVTGILFAWRFLNYNSNSKGYQLGKLIILFDLSLIIFGIVGLELYANLLAAIISLFTIAYLIFITIQSMADNYRPARFLLMAWVPFSLSVVLFISTDLGLFPFDNIVRLSPLLGNAIETILIAFALSDRVARLKEEVYQAQQREREHLYKYNLLLSSENASLEEAVERRTLELEKISNIKDRFFSIVAHDLRNPLHSLAALLNLFQNEISKNISREKIISIVQKLSAMVQNTVDLTENLLVWAKSQMENEKLILEEVELSEVVRQSVSDLSAFSINKEIEIINEVNLNTFIVVDKRHLMFVVRNLLANAIKFNLPGGKVIMRSVCSDGYIHFQVIDNGIGMTKESVQSIFQLDARKNTFGTKGEKGTGLGLHLCKEFIEKNNGSIYVKSELGQGSVFVISLPGAELKNIPSLKRKRPAIVNEFSFPNR